MKMNFKKVNLETINCILLCVILGIVAFMVIRQVRENFVIEYSPLPCDSDGNTEWDSNKQVGHETCVEYGTEGATKDPKAAKLGAIDLNNMSITNTIKDKALTKKNTNNMIVTDSSGNIVGLTEGRNNENVTNGNEKYANQVEKYRNNLAKWAESNENTRGDMPTPPVKPTKQ